MEENGGVMVGEPKVVLNGDLPRIESDEFGEFLRQWHLDHNGEMPEAEDQDE